MLAEANQMFYRLPRWVPDKKQANNNGNCVFYRVVNHKSREHKETLGGKIIINSVGDLCCPRTVA
jgi:hypothetical protein